MKVFIRFLKYPLMLKCFSINCHISFCQIMTNVSLTKLFIVRKKGVITFLLHCQYIKFKDLFILGRENSYEVNKFNTVNFRSEQFK